MSLPNRDPGEAPRDSAYALASLCTRVHQRQGARMAERANGPGECLWICWCVVAPVVHREMAGEKDTKRKQEEGRLAGPDAGGWATAAAGGSQTIRFERFTLQASTSGGGIELRSSPREMLPRIRSDSHKEPIKLGPKRPAPVRPTDGTRLARHPRRR